MLTDVCCCRALLLVLSLLLPGFAIAAPPPPPPTPLTEAARDFVTRQTRGLPGKVTVAVEASEARLGPCTAFDPFLPGNGRLWGKTSVGVRCLGPSNWTVFLPVQVSVHGTYLRTRHALNLGQVLAPNDIEVIPGDLTELPDAVLTDPAQAVGRPPKVALAPGQPLRDDQLVVVPAVRQGQPVRLISTGPGFSVSSEGTALANAAAGQPVRVRGNSGQTLSGIARPGGIVEIPF